MVRYLLLGHGGVEGAESLLVVLHHLPAHLGYKNNEQATWTGTRKLCPWEHNNRFSQCCGSGFGSGLDPDPGGKKWPTKMEKLINFIFWSAGCSLLRSEGFSCRLDVLGLGISKLLYFFSCIFFNFWSPNPWIRNRIHLKCWIRIRIHNTGFNL